MRWTHGTVALTTLAVAVIAFLAGRWSARTPADICPELAGVDRALAALSEGELEARLRTGAMLPPSATEKQIAGLRAEADAGDPDRRACTHRAALARAVAGQELARRTTPSLWGLGHPSDEIRRLFLTEALTTGWSKEDRLDVIAQLDETTIPRLAGGGADDLEHWRRRYYGLALLCSATADVLTRLGAARPADCPKLAPRRPAP